MKDTLLLGIGDYGSSNVPGETVKTLALGSCVAVILLHPKARVVGMIHVALPESKIDPQKGELKPGYFADTGIPALIEQMKAKGCNGSNKNFIVKLVGGACVLDPNNTFNIGKRNLVAIKNILWSLGMGAVAEDTGSNISRTVDVDVDLGRITIYTAGRENRTI